MLIKNAMIYNNAIRDFLRADMRIDNGIITEIGKEVALGSDDAFDANGLAMVPGLVDVHTHGRAGYDFVDVPSDKLSVVAKDYARHGITTVMPTIASAPFEQMCAAAERINMFSPQQDGADLCGVHLEGRYLNPKRKGAHADALICSLNAEELDTDVFRMCSSLHISAAYELDSDGSFASKALQMGATLALGHTDATYAQAKTAEKRGVTAYTHLFNAMPPLHHRDGGAVCAALNGDRFAELICDGIHISPEMIRLAYSCLGYKRTVLVSDSMEATGCDDGEYSIAGNPVTVKDGRAYTHEGALAGSTLTLDKAVNNLIDFCDIPLSDAILCATENPSREIGVFDTRGSLEVGKRADLLLINGTKKLDIRRVMVNGNFLEI